jgi:hypothetical protein
VGPEAAVVAAFALIGVESRFFFVAVAESQHGRGEQQI